MLVVVCYFFPGGESRPDMFFPLLSLSLSFKLNVTEVVVHFLKKTLLIGKLATVIVKLVSFKKYY